MWSEQIANEINFLLKEQLLVKNSYFAVVYAAGNQIHHTIQEIGKLREINFRMIGEGTGNECDVDRFDEIYTHVIVLDLRNKAIAAACRIAQLDVIYKQYGFSGIYSFQEFEFDSAFMEKLPKTVECSRLFINSNLQRKFYGLYLLLCGMARLMYKLQNYSHLLGSVSISKECPAVVHDWIIEYCKTYLFDADVAELIQARTPYISTLSREHQQIINNANLKSFTELEMLLQNTTDTNYQIPILFEKYELFGGRYISFAVDEAFSSVTDAVILVDLPKANFNILQKFMGRENTLEYFANHGTSERI